MVACVGTCFIALLDQTNSILDASALKQISLASGYASHHSLSRSSSSEIGRIVAGRASGVKISWGTWHGLLSVSEGEGTSD